MVAPAVPDIYRHVGRRGNGTTGRFGFAPRRTLGGSDGESRAEWTDSGFELHPVSPNPSRGGFTVACTLSTPAEIALVLFDVRGRWVTSLASGPRGAGSHAVAFDRILRARVYVCRLRSNDRTTTQKLVIR